jgi:hypothetical protein
MHRFKAWLLLVGPLTLPLGLGACNNGFLSGAASMQIEVEVYKGPLGKDPWSQWGELIGLVDEATTALAHYDPLLATLQVNNGCTRRLPEHPDLKGDRRVIRELLKEDGNAYRDLAPTSPFLIPLKKRAKGRGDGHKRAGYTRAAGREDAG